MGERFYRRARCLNDGAYRARVSGMSVAEIIREIPRLSLAERRMLAAKIVELEPERETLDICDHLADEAMQVLDRMEEDDARRSKG